MHWFRERWGGINWSDAVVQVILGLIATAVVNEVVDDPQIRDIGIVSFWLAIILGGMALLGVRTLKPNGTTSEGSGGVTSEELEKRLQAVRSELVSQQAAAVRSAPPSPPPVSGETIVKEVLRRISPWITNPDVALDYNPARDRGDYMGAYQEFAALLAMRLGEMALIRRLGVAPNQQQPLHRCKAVLQSSGITHIETSFAKLEDAGAIETMGEMVKLTVRGQRMVYLSNQVLVHDEGLVTAYREITPIINEAVRFDRP